MKSFLLRMLYALVCLVVFWLVFPLFMGVLGLSIDGQVMQLVKIIIACLALVYVFFGPAPKAPWE